MKKLLKVYQDVDAYIDKEMKNCDNIACHKGCDACCKKSSDVMVFQPEAFNIVDYIAEKATTAVGQKMLEQMKAATSETEECPFLVEGECGVYEVRPLACRTYYVHGEPCTEEEVHQGTRTQDMHLWDLKDLIPLHRPLIEELYGVKDPNSQDAMFLSGAAANYAYPLNKVMWPKFAEGVENQMSASTTDKSDPDSK
ncbi:MAG TPA: YkgJ family cysteine cluster protein [Candidatus Gracilibacteria bacterium]|nr:YkgJ family cysteine cluster protein [Candidatus Gracilibacteria bacterium]